MDKQNKICPLMMLRNTSILKQDWDCEKENCAWWCDWTKSCAMVAIPGEISDRIHDLQVTLER